jgi:hypothetical protein
MTAREVLQRLVDRWGTELEIARAYLAQPEPTDEAQGEDEHDPEWDEIPPFDPAKAPRCPKCRTYGHQHRKDCPYRNNGMDFHVYPDAAQDKESAK